MGSKEPTEINQKAGCEAGATYFLGAIASFGTMFGMGISVILVLVGIGIVLIGRWLYRNPNKMVPGWGILNPENPGVKRVARAYATFMIFFGTAVCAGQIATLVAPAAITPIVLIASIAGAWWLRPQVPQSVQGPSEIPSANLNPSELKQPLLSGHWKRALAILVGLAFLLVVVLMAVMADSDVATRAVAAAEASPSVRRHLGEPIKRGLFISGSIEVSGSSGHADLAIPISGPKGKATLYAVARKSADVWDFDTFQVAMHDSGDRVDLLNAPASSAAPSAP